MTTKDRLVEAAERLFAEQGIDGVSLRQIAAAAEQRNNAAAHYHFGDKESLIRSVFENRQDAINARREALARGAAGDVRALVNAIIRPMADMAEDPEAGYYVRFLHRLFHHAGGTLLGLASYGLPESALHTGALLDAALTGLPPRIRTQRLELLVLLVIPAIADRARRVQEGTADDVGAEAYCEGLIDAATGLLTAPVTASTARAFNLHGE